MPRRVGQQVAKHLDDARLVCHNPGQVGWDLDAEVVPVPADVEVATGLACQDREVRGLRNDRKVSRLYASNIEEVCDERAHPVGLIEDDPMKLVHFGRVHF